MSAGIVLMPKGENRTVVNEILLSNNIAIPEFVGKCLFAEQQSKHFGLVREVDIPTLLEGQGLGFMGSDTYEEIPKRISDGLVFDPVAPNGLVVALGMPYERQDYQLGNTVRIATRYPRMARRCLDRLGIASEVSITMGGCVEAAPRLSNSCDAIVDVVKSGETMMQNDIEIIAAMDEVMIGAVWKR